MAEKSKDAEADYEPSLGDAGPPGGVGNWGSSKPLALIRLKLDKLAKEIGDSSASHEASFDRYSVALRDMVRQMERYLRFTDERFDSMTTRIQKLEIANRIARRTGWLLFAMIFLNCVLVVCSGMLLIVKLFGP